MTEMVQILLTRCMTDICAASFLLGINPPGWRVSAVSVFWLLNSLAGRKNNVI
jgi:hypothetical protein